jgi:hypothetical protein
MFTTDQWLPWMHRGTEWGGQGYIAGELRVADIPRARKIWVTERATYRLVAVVFSGPNGEYRIEGLNPEIEFDLRGQDWARVYGDDIRNAVKPKPYTP